MKYSLLFLFALISTTVKSQCDTFYLDDYWERKIQATSDFDSSSFDFAIQNSSIWMIGTPAKNVLQPDTADTNQAIVTYLDTTYGSMEDSYFEFVLGSNNYGLNKYLSFDYKIDTDSMDGGYIEISFNDTDWYNVVDLCNIDTFQQFGFVEFHANSNLYTSNDTLFNGEAGFSGTQTEWKTVEMALIFELPLKTYNQTRTDSTFFRFHFVSDSIGNNRDGWMIDNLKYEYVDMGTGISELNNSIQHNVYPNPAENQITFQFDEFIDYQLTVHSIQGKVIETIKSSNTNQFTLERGNISAGMYFYQIQTSDNHSASGTFIFK